MLDPLPIDDAKVKRNQEYRKAEYNEVVSYDESKAELELLAKKGCLLYDDCKACPLFKKGCPL